MFTNTERYGILTPLVKNRFFNVVLLQNIVYSLNKHKSMDAEHHTVSEKNVGGFQQWKRFKWQPGQISFIIFTTCLYFEITTNS